MKTVLKIWVFLLLFCLTSITNAQETDNDSFDLTNYNSIREAYFQAFDNHQYKRAGYFANLYLRKAKKEDWNTIEHIHGHYFMYEVSEFKEALMHLDTIIDISKYLKNDPKYPENAYFLKAGLYYDQEDLKNALDNYLIALDVAEKKGNAFMISVCKNSIGLLKAERIGQEREALVLLKQSLTFYDTIQDKSEYIQDYAALLFSLSENYRRLNVLDSSAYFNKLGLEFSDAYGYDFMRPYFIYGQGISSYSAGYPKSAIEKLKQSLPELDLPNKIIAHYYLSKSYQELDNTDKKVFHLKALDSLQDGQSIYVLELRKGIEDLFEFYKEQGDLEKQLKYTMRLTALDSIYFNDYKALVHTLDVKYDDKQLKYEKEVLIQQLNASMSSSQKLTYIIGGLLIIMVTIFYYFHHRQLKIKQQFKEIMSTEVQELKIRDQKQEDIDISQEIIDSVLERLDDFERNRGYIQPNINAYELCRIANVNKKYLVKILKYTKQKGIISYINDLRVSLAMERLKTDPSFQKYTIKGISEEVGFSNPKSFNKSFDRVFKISAKNFIDELKKIEVNSQN